MENLKGNSGIVEEIFASLNLDPRFWTMVKGKIVPVSGSTLGKVGYHRIPISQSGYKLSGKPNPDEHMGADSGNGSDAASDITKA